MKSRICTLVTLLGLASTATLAHTGVKDPQVMARMNLMVSVAEDMKVLGAIAKGQTAFDLKIVTETSDSLTNHAREIEALFEDQAGDPKSEAKDTIWTDWDGFLKIATDMETAALALGDVNTKSDFSTAFRALGKTCSACHEGYRINTD